jgi:phosphopantothenoylcysteine decarboxylase/phosphopantothenate--cysteine ligase
LNGKTILLGITGGIAVYKAATLASRLTQAGADVHVIMSANATKFVTPLTFQALTRNKVHTDTFTEDNPSVISHIDLADRADLFLIVPATANTIGKMANGIADDMLLTTWLATTAQTMVAPAMNGHMLEQPAVQQNIAILQSRGVHFVEPGVGQLACGYIGKGRLAEPDEIFMSVEKWFKRLQQLAGIKVLVTAGGTREAIDPVRYIGNRSSGKMGHALALAAARSGAHVDLITTAKAPVHHRIHVTAVETALQMYEQVMAKANDANIIIMCAAVADYRPVTVFEQKRKKSKDTWTVDLVKNPDILAELGAAGLSAFLVGFAAETERLHEHAMDKLRRKQCDIMIANDVSVDGVGFSHETNKVAVFGKDGLLFESALQDKYVLAEQLIELIVTARRGS